MVTMVFAPAFLQPHLALLTDNGSGQSPAFLLLGSDVARSRRRCNLTHQRLLIYREINVSEPPWRLPRH